MRPPLFFLTGLVVLGGTALSGQEEPPALDLLIRGGTVIDGTGAEPRPADVGVKDGRIVAVGPLGERRAGRVIEAAGLVVAPGFIDTHTHADADALRLPEAASFLRMGVTTIVTGNCGGSVRDLGKHFARLEKTGLSLNYASLIGHGTVRRAVMKLAHRAPTREELARMKALVRQAMEAGAVGLSTGLIYVPGTYAKTEELIELARVVAEHGGLYATHMRDEGRHVLRSIDEALRIGREAGCAVQLSHLKASGKRNWGLGKKIVERLRRAREEGLRVTGDQYAYTASSTSIDVLFPTRELAVGRRAFAKKLAEDETFRRGMRAALEQTARGAGFEDLSYCRIANAPGNTQLNGLTLDAAARQVFGRDDLDRQTRLAIKLVVDSRGRRVSMVYHKMCEEDVETIMRAPFVSVACDAGIRDPHGTDRPHPRGCGNNPRVLARYVRERRTLSLPLAIHKMTGLPARIFGFKDRGVLRPGAWADLTLFDPAKVADRATYKEPKLPPAGLPYVIVNGIVVVDRGRHTGERPGKILRHHPRK